ncbi:MAG: hypothetical protein KDC15_05305 [Chitinophagaceae bacterium]|nr:hypothetical protein [Chitinophagaceae bacterium]
MIKKYFSNPYFLMLLASNLYCIWYFKNHDNGFVTVVWIYWIQSVIIGFFNFIDLLTIKNYDPGTAKLNGQPITEKNVGCLPWFFLLHYGLFHFVYGIFLLIKFSILKVDKSFLLIGVAAFLAESLAGFIRRKTAEQEKKFNIGSLFFLPYLRIIPMHLIIMVPAFLGVEPSIVFLVLKTIADIFSFILYQRMWQKASGV